MGRVQKQGGQDRVTFQDNEQSETVQCATTTETAAVLASYISCCPTLMMVKITEGLGLCPIASKFMHLKISKVAAHPKPGRSTSSYIKLKPCIKLIDR